MWKKDIEICGKSWFHKEVPKSAQLKLMFPHMFPQSFRTCFRKFPHMFAQSFRKVSAHVSAKFPHMFPQVSAHVSAKFPQVSAHVSYHRRGGLQQKHGDLGSKTGGN